MLLSKLLSRYQKNIAMNYSTILNVLQLFCICIE